MCCVCLNVLPSVAKMGRAREGGDSVGHYVRIYPVMVWFPVAFLSATPFLDLLY